MTNKFEIHIGTNSVDSRIICDGVDISRAFRSIQITQSAGQPPTITLEIAPYGTIHLDAEAQATVKKLSA